MLYSMTRYISHEFHCLFLFSPLIHCPLTRPRPFCKADQLALADDRPKVTLCVISCVQASGHQLFPAHVSGIMAGRWECWSGGDDRRSDGNTIIFWIGHPFPICWIVSLCGDSSAHSNPSRMRSGRRRTPRRKKANPTRSHSSSPPSIEEPTPKKPEASTMISTWPMPSSCPSNEFNILNLNFAISMKRFPSDRAVRRPRKRKEKEAKRRAALPSTYDCYDPAVLLVD